MENKTERRDKWVFTSISWSESPLNSYSFNFTYWLKWRKYIYVHPDFSMFMSLWKQHDVTMMFLFVDSRSDFIQNLLLHQNIPETTRLHIYLLVNKVNDNKKKLLYLI